MPPFTVAGALFAVFRVPSAVAEQIVAAQPSPSVWLNYAILATLCLVAAVFQAIACARALKWAGRLISLKPAVASDAILLTRVVPAVVYATCLLGLPLGLILVLNFRNAPGPELMQATLLAFVFLLAFPENAAAELPSWSSLVTASLLCSILLALSKPETLFEQPEADVPHANAEPTSKKRTTRKSVG